MRLKPDTLLSTITLACMTAIVPLATDIFIPSMPEMARAMRATIPQTQLTLSCFMIGYAFGQMFYGPIADRHGRRPVLLVAFVLFALASIACALAPTIEAMVVARVFQALGGAGPAILARAMVRDLYEGQRAARELSRMGAIMGLTPAIAPVIGALLQNAFGWRASFVLVAILGVSFLAFVALALPETLRERRPEPVSPANILAGYRVILRSAAFRVCAAQNAFAFGGLFAFISASSFILQDLYGLTPTQFGLAFGYCCISFVIGSTLAARIIRRSGVTPAIGLGVVLLAAGGLLQLGGALLWPERALALILPMSIYTLGIGLVLPPSLAAAMAPFPDRAGAASSLVGVTQTSFGAFVGLVISYGLGASALPLPIATAIMGVCALTLFVLTRRIRAG